MVSNQTQPKPQADAIFTIDKRSNISQVDLIKDYIEPSIPVVLTDAARDWGAMAKLTPQYFKENYGHISKEINGVNYKMADVVDMIIQATPEKQAPYPYNFNIKKYFPELLQDFKPEILYSKSDRINHPLLPKILFNGTTPYEIFLGGKGSFFPFLHIDALNLHTQITQIYGSKDFILYPPEQTPYLYPNADNKKFSRVDIFNPDYEKYPLFKKAKPLKFTLNERETLLFPTGWWHSTQIHEPCISFGRSQLNAANWDLFIADNKAMKKKISFLASPLLAYGKIAGGIMNRQERKVL
jgi:histone arginine demethylase JMJD6